MRIAVSVGHHPEGRGAAAEGWAEYELLAPCAGYLVRDLTRMGHRAYLVPSGRLREKVDWINGHDFDLAVELHGDAGGGSGGTALYCPGSAAGKPFAEAIDDAMEAVLGADRRPAKPGYYLGDRSKGPLYFLRATNCPAVVVEPEYLKARLSTFIESPEEIAEAIADGIAAEVERVA